MDDQVKTFKSHDGTLFVGHDGIKIKRTFAQALKSGKLLQREQHIPYSALDKIGHRDPMGQTGHLQFTLKSGQPGSTPLNRHPKIRFQAKHGHVFRQAQRLIETNLANQIESHPTSTSSSNLPTMPFRR